MRISVLPTLFTIFSLVAASPIPLDARDVYTPPILYPHAGTVWIVNQHHNVTWDNSDPPTHITNPIGQILLRKGGLATNITLASGFSILLGRIVVQVPDVAPGSDYQLVLFGDSGNFSPDFTITN